MSTALGLLGMVAFIICVIGLAAAVTWTVVRLSPADKSPAEKPAAPS